MDSGSEAKLQLICPALAFKIVSLETMLKDESIVFRVTQGLRTWAEQDALYQQGRTTEGKIVTNAPAGHSQHNFGLAVDVVPMIELTPDWNINHPAWKRLIQVGESLGLVSGSQWRTFPDNPHFELTGKWPSSPNDEERQAFQDGNLQNVWDKAGL